MKREFGLVNSWRRINGYVVLSSLNMWTKISGNWVLLLGGAATPPPSPPPSKVVRDDPFLQGTFSSLYLSYRLPVRSGYGLESIPALPLFGDGGHEQLDSHGRRFKEIRSRQR
jgi:hypothetical protein